MGDADHSSLSRLFPARGPEIEIAPLDVEPFPVDCRELWSWFVVPQLGERAVWATYDAPSWGLTGVTELHAARPARVHDVKGVEIEVAEWEPDGSRDWTMYGRVTDVFVEWLATVTSDGGERVVYTFLEEGFDHDWGRMGRRIEDKGRFRAVSADSYRWEPGAETEMGAGVYEVRIGERRFTCLRALDVNTDPEGELGEENGILFEAFLTEQGRTVLGRRYNARRWGTLKDGKHAYRSRATWDEELPESRRVSINGVTFVHWHDCLSGIALGMGRPRELGTPGLG